MQRARTTTRAFARVGPVPIPPASERSKRRGTTQLLSCSPRAAAASSADMIALMSALGVCSLCCKRFLSLSVCCGCACRRGGEGGLLCCLLSGCLWLRVCVCGGGGGESGAASLGGASRAPLSAGARSLLIACLSLTHSCARFFFGPCALQGAGQRAEGQCRGEALVGGGRSSSALCCARSSRQKRASSRKTEHAPPPTNHGLVQ